ncbi:MAG: hypothetical protein MJ053_01700, partial [Elusimicrobiaceae bacterium]|nr:hypothetical protein [Elusimicrobiaceae bacterium]
VALPQYQKAVEKARMTGAVGRVKKIAEAQQRCFLANGRYALFSEWDALDIDIPYSGTVNYNGQDRPKIKDFIYTCYGNATQIALAHRLPVGTRYYIYVSTNNPNKIICETSSTVTPVRKKVCRQHNTNGYLSKIPRGKRGERYHCYDQVVNVAGVRLKSRPRGEFA